MKYITYCLALLLLSTATAAPIPRKPIKNEQRQGMSGKYKLMWDGFEWVMWFDPKTKYTHTECSIASVSKWDGSYTWDAKERILLIQEKPTDLYTNNWLLWQVTLDKDGKGVATITQTGSTIEVSFTPLKDE